LFSLARVLGNELDGADALYHQPPDAAPLHLIEYPSAYVRGLHHIEF